MAHMTTRKKWDEIELMGHRIREARERLGLTQGELAERIGKSQDAISHYETGDRAVVVTELPLLAEVLKVPLSYFFGRDDLDSDVQDLIVELKMMSPEGKKKVLERWRFELEWWMKQDLAQQRSP